MRECPNSIADLEGSMPVMGRFNCFARIWAGSVSETACNANFQTRRGVSGTTLSEGRISDDSRLDTFSLTGSLVKSPVLEKGGKADRPN